MRITRKTLVAQNAQLVAQLASHNHETRKGMKAHNKRLTEELAKANLDWQAEKARADEMTLKVEKLAAEVQRLTPEKAETAKA